MPDSVIAAAPELRPVPAPPSRKEFWRWAVTTLYTLRTALGVGAIIAAALTIKSFFPSLLPSNWMGKSLVDLDKSAGKAVESARVNLAFVQAAACGLLALFTPKPSLVTLERKIVDKNRLQIAQEACENVHLTVVCLFVSWLLYYAVAAITASMKLTGPYPDAFITTLDTVTTVILFWMYLELSRITLGDSVHDPKSQSQQIVFARVMSVCTILAIIVPLWYAAGATKISGQASSSILLVCEVIASCLAGVALALVVGRLGSYYIDPGSGTLAFLYLYAVIQPTSAVFPEHPFVMLLATTIAFPLKVLLWLVCVWAFTTGTLAEYVYEIRVLIEEGPAHHSQLEINFR
jgi:hypothetical protein